MITKKFGIDFISNGGALTLDPKFVFFDECDLYYLGNDEVHTKLHENGWRINARVIEDYFYWINYFEAEHSKFGRVWGNFEEEVFADSEEGYQDFYSNFPPQDWDYGDI